VHNSPSGVYSVATGSTAPTTTVTGSNAVAAGWLEAGLTAYERPVPLSIADEPVPAVFHGPRSPRPDEPRPCGAPHSTKNLTQTVGVAAGFLLGAAGRRAELVMASGEADIDTLQTLAQIADACARDDASVIVLGSVQPGTTLELHVSRKASEQ
jgi:hypothetical protein